MSTPAYPPIAPTSAQQEAARTLHGLWIRRGRFAALPENIRPSTRRDGYAVQQAFEQINGQTVSGWKIAATSVDGQRHINVDGPLAGRIYQDRLLPVGATVSLKDNLMHVAEIEFAFRFAQDLPPRAAEYTVDDVLTAVASVHPSIEVPDSRYEDFVKVGTAQLIADNACACLFILGPSAADWKDFDYLNQAITVTLNGKAIDSGYGRNVLGDPRVALTWIVNELSSIGVTMKAGQFVTTGTCRVPVKVEPGDAVHADFGSLGQVGCSFSA
ncbi:MAG: 2-oxopent-4-enoate hydratase [Pseudomonadota bacterium]|jgi:2-keto-4-pentenoate hydratase|nr:hydratase [Oxalobacteraceae bacterium]